jgi:hypothetical protein
MVISIDLKCNHGIDIDRVDGEIIILLIQKDFLPLHKDEVK